MTYSIEQVKKLVDERSLQDQLLRNQNPINWDEVNSYDEESYQLMKQLFSQFGAIEGKKSKFYFCFSSPFCLNSLRNDYFS